jgi:hypothetical protein
MFERWRKTEPEYIREYEIDRIRNTATVRTLSPEGYVQGINDASKDLMDSKLTPDKLRAAGYEMKRGMS